jgi:hypothetical protein
MSLQKTVQAIPNITAHTLSVAEEDNEVRTAKSLQHKQNQSPHIFLEQYGYSRRQ